MKNPGEQPGFFRFENLQTSRNALESVPLRNTSRQPLGSSPLNLKLLVDKNEIQPDRKLRKNGF
jgi:hypothetical protein